MVDRIITQGIGRRLGKRESGTIIDRGDLGTVTVPGVGVVRPRWWLMRSAWPW